MPVKKNDVRLDFRLPAMAKRTIEEAAALMGQTVSDFAVSTLLEKANSVMDMKRTRALSMRDARAFLKILDSAEGPNAALRAAARWYKEQQANAVDD